MADIYLINTDTPKDIALEMQQIDAENHYTVLKSKTAKALLMEIEEYENNKRIAAELKRQEQEMEKARKIKPWQDFLFAKTFEPNKLTNREIEELCMEFYENFILPNKRRLKNYSKHPSVKIIEELKWWYPWRMGISGSRGYKQIVDKYLESIDDEIGIRAILGLPYTDPVYINGPYSLLINRDNNFGGIVRYGKENYRDS